MSCIAELSKCVGLALRRQAVGDAHAVGRCDCNFAQHKEGPRIMPPHALCECSKGQAEICLHDEGSLQPVCQEDVVLWDRRARSDHIFGSGEAKQSELLVICQILLPFKTHPCRAEDDSLLG